MRQVIYVDTLVILNTVITYLILMAVGALARVKTKPVRLTAASVLGGLFSLLLLFPEMPVALMLAVKMLCGVAIGFAAFFVGNLNQYFRCLGLLYLLTFACGGMLFLLSQLFAGFVEFQNGFVYIGIEFWEIILTITFAYGILMLIRRKFGKREEQFQYSIELEYNGTKAKGTALLDSGHFVTDCYTGRPVIIVGKPLIERLLPVEDLEAIMAFCNLSVQVINSRLHTRYIPVSTVSGQKILPAFTCQRVTVQNADVYYSVKNVSLAMVYDWKDFQGCDALINEKLFEIR